MGSRAQGRCGCQHVISQRAAVGSPLMMQANGAADSCSAPHLALYVAELARYGRPVWLTELACPLGPGAGNEAAQAAYMAAALDVLDRERAMERCAQHLSSVACASGRPPPCCL